MSKAALAGLDFITRARRYDYEESNDIREVGGNCDQTKLIGQIVLVVPERKDLLLRRCCGQTKPQRQEQTNRTHMVWNCTSELATAVNPTLRESSLRAPVGGIAERMVADSPTDLLMAN